MYTILIATFFIFVLLLLVCFISQKKSKRICGKHVLVTGGSSGIGKSLAKLAVKEGANVTIVARNVHNLSKAKEELEQCRLNQDQMIQVLSVDVSDCNSVRKKFSEIEETMGPIYMLANCAGLAICGKIEDLSEKDINTMINVNYLGTLYPIQAVVGGMKERRDGIIIITSSQGGLLGIFGLSVYASSKFALRGLSEALDMETRPYNINVTLALPADTDTPGYEKENTTKPLETKLISNVGGLFTPDQVARKILKDALEGNFFSSLGFESFLLTTLCVGMAPYSSFIEVLLQSIILGPLRLICSIYLIVFHNIIKNCVTTKSKDL